MRILMSNPDIDILEYPIIEHYESPRSRVISFTPKKISGNENIFPDWIRRKGYEHCFACNKIYRADMFMFVRYPEGEVFEDTFVTPMLLGSCENIYYSDCGFYYYYDNEDSISRNYSFKSQYFLYRNLVTLFKKVRDEYKMPQEANRILFRCLDNLTDLFRCSGGEKEAYKKAAEMLNDSRIDIQSLFKMELPPRSKIKYSLFAIAGAYAHGRALSLLHKKLC